MKNYRRLVKGWYQGLGHNDDGSTIWASVLQDRGRQEDIHPKRNRLLAPHTLYEDRVLTVSLAHWSQTMGPTNTDRLLTCWPGIERRFVWSRVVLAKLVVSINKAGFESQRCWIGKISQNCRNMFLQTTEDRMDSGKHWLFCRWHISCCWAENLEPARD